MWGDDKRDMNRLFRRFSFKSCPQLEQATENSTHAGHVRAHVYVCNDWINAVTLYLDSPVWIFDLDVQGETAVIFIVSGSPRASIWLADLLSSRWQAAD